MKLHSYYFKTLFCSVLLCKCIVSQNSQIDSLKGLLKIPQDDTSRINTYLFLSKEHAKLGKFEDGLIYSQLALKEIPVKIKNASESVKRILTRQLGAANNNIGLIYYYQANYTDALKHFIPAISSYEAIKDSGRLAGTYNNLGTLYRTSFNLPLARYYYNKSLILREKTGNIFEQAVVTSNLAQTYYQVDERPLTLKYTLQAYGLAKISGNNAVLSKCTRGLGNIYLAMSQDLPKESTAREELLDNSINYFLKSIDLNTKSNHLEGLSHDYYTLSTALLQKGKHQEAIKYANKSIENCLIRSDNEGMVYNYKVLSDIYFDKKDFKNAYDYLFKSNSLKDSIFNNENKKQLNELQTKYETKVKEDRITSLSREKEILNLKYSRNNIILLFIIAAIFFIVIMFLLLLRQKNLKSARLKKDMEFELVKSNLKTLRSQMNPHFIFNSLNSIQGLVNTNESTKASKFIGVFSKLTRSILDYTETQKISLADEIKFLNNYIAIESLRFDNNFTFLFETPDDLAKDDIFVPSLIIQPIVENAIIHGLFHKQGDKKLVIRISEEPDNLNWEIIDNGIGILASKEKRHERGNHKSVGMRIIMERLSLLFNLSNPDEYLTIIDRFASEGVSGTKVKIRMPKLI